MAFFDKTSTHMLSMIAAVYGVFIYSISFSLEMWFIVTAPIHPSSSVAFFSHHVHHADLSNESEVIASVPVLAFVLAAVYFVTVMVSLLLILGIIIKSMMCVLTWLITIVLMFLPECALVLFMTIYTWGIESRNGQIELCFYVIRGILNVFFVICVQNLLSQWKSEKQASTYAFNLNTYNSYPPISTPPYIDGCSTTVNPVFKYATIRGSEFDTRNFSAYTGGYGAGCYDDEEDEMDMDDIRPKESGIRYSTQSLDRRKLNGTKGNNANPYNHLNSFKEEVILRPLSQRPFDYLSRPGSVVDMSRGATDSTNRNPSFSSSDHHSSTFSSHRHKKPTHHHQQQYNNHNGGSSSSYYMTRTLPRDFERGSSTQSIRDVAL